MKKMFLGLVALAVFGSPSFAQVGSTKKEAVNWSFEDRLKKLEDKVASLEARCASCAAATVGVGQPIPPCGCGCEGGAGCKCQTCSKRTGDPSFKVGSTIQTKQVCVMTWNAAKQTWQAEWEDRQVAPVAQATSVFSADPWQQGQWVGSTNGGWTTATGFDAPMPATAAPVQVGPIRGFFQRRFGGGFTTCGPNGCQ